jgi:hypothetical protein
LKQISVPFEFNLKISEGAPDPKAAFNIAGAVGDALPALELGYRSVTVVLVAEGKVSKVYLNLGLSKLCMEKSLQQITPTHAEQHHWEDASRIYQTLACPRTFLHCMPSSHHATAIIRVFRFVTR